MFWELAAPAAAGFHPRLLEPPSGAPPETGNSNTTSALQKPCEGRAAGKVERITLPVRAGE